MSKLSDFLSKPYVGLAPFASGLAYTRTDPIVQIEATDTTIAGNDYPILNIKNNYQAINSGGRVQWQVKNASGAYVNAAYMAGSLQTLTAGAESGAIVFGVLVAGSTRYAAFRGDLAAFVPAVDHDFALGQSANRWQAIYIGDGTRSGEFQPDSGNGGMTIGSFSNHPLFLKTNNLVKARIDAAGRFAVGGATDTQAMITVAGVHMGTGTTTYGFADEGTIPATDTSIHAGFYSGASTTATSFTLSSHIGFHADNPSKGAGSTITTVIGFNANGFTAGGTNIAFKSAVAAGSTNWCVYSSGSAQSYFAGSVGINTQTNPALASLVIASNALDLVLLTGSSGTNYLKINHIFSSSGINAINVTDGTNTEFLVRGDGLIFINRATQLNGALVSVSGRMALLQNATFDLITNTAASSLYIDGAVTCATGKTAAGVTNRATPTLSGVGSAYSGIYTDVVAVATASGSAVNGGQFVATNPGAGDTYGIAVSAIATTGNTGAVTAGYFSATALVTSALTYVVQVRHSGNANQGIHIEAINAGDALDYGVAISSATLMGSAAFRYEQRSGSGALFLQYISSAAATAFAVDANGKITVAGNQVVQGRVTGYTAMTGTPDKATAYATSTVTLPQLAGRVAQLQADLTTHGLIGA